VEIRLHALLFLVLYTVRHNSELKAGYKTRSSLFCDIIQRRSVVPTCRENISVSSSTARQSWTGGFWNCARRVTTVSCNLYGKLCTACCHSVWPSVWQIMYGVLPQCLAICMVNCARRVATVSGNLMVNCARRVSTVSGHLYGKLCTACCYSVWQSVW